MNEIWLRYIRDRGVRHDEWGYPYRAFEVTLAVGKKRLRRTYTVRYYSRRGVFQPPILTPTERMSDAFSRDSALMQQITRRVGMYARQKPMRLPLRLR